tara:strand:+ start:767 stop:991 length:225 start_codon:yes stop_codon:yes gene_type:complete
MKISLAAGKEELIGLHKEMESCRSGAEFKSLEEEVEALSRDIVKADSALKHENDSIKTAKKELQAITSAKTDVR